MRTSIHILLLFLWIWPAVQVLGQENLSWAELIFERLDKRMIASQHDLPTVDERVQAERAAQIFSEAGRHFEWGSLLFYRAHWADLELKPAEVLQFLDSARVVLEGNLDEDVSNLCSARLGNVWNDYGIYYQKYRFDYERALEAWDIAAHHFGLLGMRIQMHETESNVAFALAQFGWGRRALAKLEGIELHYNDVMTGEERAGTRANSRYLAFVKGAAYTYAGDSLYHTRDRGLSQEYFSKAISYFELAKRTAPLSFETQAMIQISLGGVYLRSSQSGALDSARSNLSAAAGFYEFFVGKGADSPLGLAQTLLGAAELRSGAISEGERLVVQGLNNLEYPVTGFYDKKVRAIRPSLYLLQSLNMKLGLLNILYEKTSDLKNLQQLVFDSEQIAEMAGMFTFSFADRQTFERFSNFFSISFASGVQAASTLYEETGDFQWLERALKLNESGRGMALRHQMVKSQLGVEEAHDPVLPRSQRGDFSIASIQRTLLQDGVAAISYTVGLNQLTAMVLTADTAFSVQLPELGLWKSELVKMHRYYEEGDTRFDAMSRLVCEQIMGPVLAQLPAGTDQLIIVPDGLLWGINFDALVLDEAGGSPTYLIERYATSLSYSLSVTCWLAEQYSDRSIHRKLRIFSASYAEEARAIPQMSKMSRELSSSWPTSERIETSPVQEFWAKLSDSDISLFVAHGVAEPGMLPEEYYIELSDAPRQVMTLKNIYDMPSATRSPRMIFLASCLTASGEQIRGVGISSIARAFHYKGVPTLITAYTKMQDASTAAIASNYFRIIQSSETPTGAALALQQAKLAYLNQRERPTPNSWAPLVCMGYGGMSL